MQGTRLDVGPFSTVAVSGRPRGRRPAVGRQCHVLLPAATLVTLLGSTSVGSLFFFRADDRKRTWHGTVASKVVWRGPHGLTRRHGNGTMLHSYRTYLAIRS
jgi:hypothetical protein